MKSNAHNRGRRHSRMIHKWFLSYLIIVLIPLATGLGIYARSKDMLAQELIDTHRVFLRQLCNSIDTHFSEIDTMVFQLKNTQEVLTLSLARAPLSNVQIYTAYRLTGMLRIYKTANDFISEVSVYYPKCNAFITSNGKYDGATYYAQYLGGDEKGYAQWLSDLNRVSGTSYMSVKDVSLIASKLSEQKRSEEAVVVLHLNMRLLENHFIKQSILQQGNLLITTAQGEPVIAHGSNVSLLSDLTVDITGEDVTRLEQMGFLYTSIVSDENNWRYSFLTPYAQVTEKTQYIINYTLLITLIGLFISILGALMFSHIQYKPLSHLVSSVSRQSTIAQSQDSEYRILEKHIENLNTRRASMEEQLSMQGMRLGLDNLRRLLLGYNYATESEHELLEQYGITFGGSYFRVISIACEDIASLGNVFFSEVSAVFQAAFDHTIIYTLPVSDRICCVINTAKCDEERDRALLDHVFNELSVRTDSALWISVSLYHKELITLPAAYAESVRAMEQRTVSQSGAIVFYDDSKQRAAFGGIYYPNGFDTRMIHVLCSGDLNAMNACLDEIIEQNLQKNITAKQCTYLGYHLCMSYLKAAKECQATHAIDLSNFMEALIRSVQIDQIALLRKHYAQMNAALSEKISSLNKDHTQKLIERIKECISERYADPTLNVNTLSDLLMMNPSYLSRAFTEKTGETLSGYLQRIRIHAALPLLIKDMAVAQVMGLVGYANIATFTRAFKKEIGVTPGAYRESKGKNLSSEEIK